MTPGLPHPTTRRRAAAAIVVATCVALAAACEPRHPALPHRPSAPATARVFADRPLDTLWARALDAASGVAMPEYLVTDGANVYVGDAASRTLLALDARTGTPRWTAAARGDTSALVAPRAFAPRRAGGVLVFDAERRALVALSRDGRVEARTPLPDVEAVRAVCEVGDGTYLVAATAPSTAVVQVAASGRPLGVRPLPWPDLGTASALLRAVLLAPTPHGCVGALAFGRGLAAYADTAFRPPFAYVEPTPLAGVHVTRRVEHGDVIVSESLAEHVLAALDLATTSTEILVAFDGRSADRAHVVDVYDAGGAYRVSYRTARRVDALAASDDALFVLTKLAGAATVVALRRPSIR